MKYIVYFTILLLSFTACSVQRKLEKSIVGKTMYEVVQERGKPQEVRRLRDGGKLYIYKDYKALNTVNINTGEFQYEKLRSAGGVRSEWIYITFSPEGEATEVEMESDFTR